MFFEKKKFNSSLKKELFISVKIERTIIKSIDKNGDCKICLSGGSSPQNTLIQLSKSDKIDWSKVIFFLTDERVTALNSNQSNYGNLKSIFKNTPVIIEPFYNGVNLNKSIISYQRHIKKYLLNEDDHFDLLILGFGEDGHIASLFPEDKKSPQRQEDVFYVNKIVNGYDRLSLSMKRLKKSKQTIMISYGETKYDLIENRKGFNYPILEFLRNQENVSWFYSI